ncbi:MAG: DUF3987 domain-containing protein [Candidatus Methanosuratincola petrocarbonis]
MGGKKKRKRYPLLEIIEERQKEVQEILTFYLDLKKFIEEIRKKDDLVKILSCCPPGSILEEVVLLTERHTDIPPSISFYAMLTLLGAKLTQMDFRLQLETQSVRPNLWVLCLASSGAGKTYTINHICLPALNDVETLPETATAPAYIQLLAEHPEKTKGIIIRDEVAQLFKMIKKDSYMELKDFFLRSYDGAKIERRTKKDGLISVENVYISFLGTTVLETFTRALNQEDLLDGFMQRFLFNIAEKVQKVVPLYIIPQDSFDRIRQEYQSWVSFLETVPERTLTISKKAVKLFEEWYTAHFDRSIESYFRRYMFAALKIATIYKLLSLPRENSMEIEKEHLGWAIRVITRNLDSLYKLMNEYLSFDDYDSLIRRVERYITEHPGCKRRDILQNVWGLKSVKQLRAILEFLAEKGNPKAAELLS